MENNIPFELIAKLLSCQSTKNEKMELQKWINASTDNKEIYEQMKKSWDEVPSSKYEPNIEDALKKVSRRLPEQKTKIGLARNNLIRIAAIFIVGLGLFGVINFFSTSSEVFEFVNNTKTTQKITLPDGSKVVLSPNSEICYPEYFTTNQRRVEFSGEAYFDIGPNKAKPFIIESGMSIIKVLGTEFNLKAKKTDTLIKVTVTEGLVSLNLKLKEVKEEILVNAGEVGKLDVVKKQLSKEENKDPNFMAWKDGKLSFENKVLKVALEELSNYYGIQFIAPYELENEFFNGYFDNFSIEQAKSNLEMLLDVTIHKQGNVLVLKPN